ncbi:MAG TPA: T9SS type A sorting domain-containing protein [Flavobacterium sp.]
MNLKLLSLMFLIALPNVIFAQAAECGSIYVDNGGLEANYLNNSNQTVTICPYNPGEIVTVEFTSFDIEANMDGLYVFDGASTASPQISSGNPAGSVPGGVAGAFWGTEIPGPFTSTHQSGCLTFMFKSGGTGTRPGWLGYVNCAPPFECNMAPENLSVTELTATSAVLSWTESGMAYSWEVLALPCGSAAPTAAAQGIVGTSNPFIISGLTPGVCYDFYVRSACSSSDISPWTGPVSATTTNGDAIALAAYIDTNSNGAIDAGEALFNHGFFHIQANNSGIVESAYVPSGLYSFEVTNAATTYDLSFSFLPNLVGYYTSPTSYNDVTVVENSGLTTFYFPITVVTPYNDVLAYIYPWENPRPGFEYTQQIVYKNLGLVPTSGSLSFTKAPPTTITNITQSGTVATSTGFTYTYANLMPNESRTFNVTLAVPTIPTVNLGDLLTNSITITSTVNDVNPGNNSFNSTRTVVGSYDPNDITETHGPQILHSGFTAADYLYYTIRFQNTGTANAEIVRVENLLNSQLDASTIQMVGASHDYSMSRTGNQLTWQFNDIQLPPQSADDEASNGYILYKVKPAAGYAVGDIIPNTANIFFDFNSAIVTNTFNTEFVNALAVPNFLGSGMTVYPNPANSAVNVSMRSSADLIQTILITDLLGKQIIDTQVNASDATIDVSSLSKGLYIIQINTDSNNRQVRKLIIN